jgi:hypothetical protein
MLSLGPDRTHVRAERRLPVLALWIREARPARGCRFHGEALVGYECSRVADEAARCAGTEIAKSLVRRDHPVGARARE